MKPHFKPPASHLQTAFHAARPALFSLLFTLFSLHSSASVPLAWQVTPRNPAPVAFDRHHGETLELRCTFTGFGELPFAGSGAVAPRLYYQTNGMAVAWWSVPASVSSNVLSATFPPSADPGADRLSLFFGAPSNAYASAVLRLRHSPGFTPNVLPPPNVTIWAEDLAAVRALIDYSTSNTDLVATIKATVPVLTTNDVKNIVTNEVYEWEYTGLPNGAIIEPGYPSWAVGFGWQLAFTLDGVLYYGTTRSYPETATAVTLNCIAQSGQQLYSVSMHRYSRNTLNLATIPLLSSACTAATNYTDLATQSLIHVEQDPTVPAWAKTPTPPTSGLTTNDVCNIVTNDTLGLARLVDLPPLTNSIPDTAARAVYDVHDLMWDESESILYWHKIRQGHDEYIAVTNIDLTHPTNAVILKAWREANR